MANSTRDLVLEFAANTAPLKKATSDVRKSVAGASKDAEKSGQSFGAKLFGSVGGAAKKAMSAAWTATKTVAKAGAGAVAAVSGAALVKGFKRLTAIEDATAKLEGLGNSAKQTKSIMDNALQSVKGTAFGMDEAANTAASAVAAGIKPGQQLTKYLRLTADAATIAGTSMADMGSIINKVTTAGKAQTDDLNQLADRGIPIWTELAKHYKVSGTKMREMVTKGKVDAKTFRTVLNDMVGGSAVKAADTTTGAFKNMGAALSRVGAQFLTGVFPFFKKTFSGITNLLDAIGPRAEKMGKSLGKFLKPAMKAFEDLTSGLGSGDLSAITGLFSPVITVIKQLLPVLATFGKAFKGVVSDQVASFGAALGKIKIQPFIDALTMIGTALTSVMLSLGKVDLGAVFSGLATAFGAVIKVIPLILPPIMQLVSVLTGALGDILPVIAKSIGQLAKVLGGVLAAVLPPVVAAIGTMIDVLSVAINTVLPAIMPIILTLAKVIGKNLAVAFKVAADIISVIVETALPPLLDLFDALMPIIATLIKTLLPPLAKIFQSLLPILTPIVAVFAQLVTAILPVLTTVLKALTPLILLLATLLAKVLGVVAKAITWFVKWITTTGNVSKAFGKLRDNVKAVVSWIGSSLSKFVKNVGRWFADMGRAIVKPFTKAAESIAKFWTKIKNAFSGAKNWVGTTWRKGWSKVSGWLSSGVSKGGEKIGGALKTTRTKFANLKTNIGTSWRKGWSNVSDWMSSSVGKGRDKIGGFLTSARDKFSAIKTFLSGKWRAGWKKAEGWIAGPIEAAKKAIAKILGGKGLQAVFRNAVAMFGKIFGGLKKAVGKPINAMIDFINKGLIRGGINKILNALGVPKKEQIPWITPVSFATGGPVTGPGTGTSDSFLIRASNNEHMLTAAEVRKLGGHRKILAWRKAVRQGKAYDAPPGYAGGGVVRPVPGGFGSFPSYPGHTGVDFPVGMNTAVHAVMAGLIKSARSLTTSYGRHIIQSLPIGGNYEALYAHLNSFKVRSGQRVGAGDVIGYSDSTGNSTGPHLHFTLQHPGGDYVNPTSFLNGGKAPGGDSGGGITGLITDAIGFLKGLSPVKWLQGKVGGIHDSILKFLGDHPWARGLARVPGLIVDKAKDYMADKLFGGVLGGGEPAGSGVERWRSTIVSALKMNGLPTTSAYVDAWLRQVKSESGGNPKAVQNGYVDVNTISGDLAKGLLQTISGTFNAFKFPGHGDIFNGLDNALAAIHYAKSKYGKTGMLGVIGHGHGYDAGGYLPPGISVAMNKTGRPEPVLTGQQWDALTADPQPHTINVHFHGVIDSSSAAREIENLLRGRNRQTSGVRLPARTRRAAATS